MSKMTQASSLDITGHAKTRMFGRSIALVACLAIGCLFVAFLESEYSGSPHGNADIGFMINPLSLLFHQRVTWPDAGKSKLAEASVAEYSTSIPPVQVLVCVEALCIDSKRFFHDQLMIAFNALGHDVVNWTVVPFGNAKLPPDDEEDSRTVTCQHGVGECDANTYEQCARYLYPDPAQHVPYLACLFSSLPMGRRDTPFRSVDWIGALCSR
jgi:hypothetical protein